MSNNGFSRHSFAAKRLSLSAFSSSSVRGVSTPKARRQMLSPSVHSWVCICAIFAGSGKKPIPGQACAAFFGSAGTCEAASPICEARCSIISC